MDPEVVNLIVNLGGTGILAWLVLDMRREANAQREQTWALLEFLIRRENPDFSWSDLPAVGKRHAPGAGDGVKGKS